MKKWETKELTLMGLIIDCMWGKKADGGEVKFEIHFTVLG